MEFLALEATHRNDHMIVSRIQVKQVVVLLFHDKSVVLQFESMMDVSS